TLERQTDTPSHQQAAPGNVHKGCFSTEEAQQAKANRYQCHTRQAHHRGSDLATQLYGKQRSDKTRQCDRDQCICSMELTIAMRIREVEHSDERCSLQRDAKQ